MSNNIDTAQRRAMAMEIANLLDANEETQNTRGNGQIEASIWNKFVGEGQPKENQVGNGEKSLIKNSISISQAVNSISSYIKNKGVDAMVKALSSVGISWNPGQYEMANRTFVGQKSEVTDNTEESGQVTPSNTMTIRDLENMSPEDQQKMKTDAAKKILGDGYKVVTEQKGSNGYTFINAYKTYTGIREKAVDAWRKVVHEEDGKSRHKNELLYGFATATNNPYAKQNVEYIMQDALRLGFITPEEMDTYQKAKADCEEIQRNNPDVDFMEVSFYMMCGAFDV